MGDTREISVSVTIFTPREILFDLWIQPEHLALWYPPDDATDARAVIGARSGGSWDVSWKTVGGARESDGGRYVAVDPPARLAYRTPGTPAAEVVVRLSDGGGSTELTITESGSAGTDLASVRAGWTARLQRLIRYLSVI